MPHQSPSPHSGWSGARRRLHLQALQHPRQREAVQGDACQDEGPSRDNAETGPRVPSFSRGQDYDPLWGYRVARAKDILETGKNLEWVARESPLSNTIISLHR